MFCPKCGGQNPESGKFCRSCGTDLSNVSDAMAGKPTGRSHRFGLMEPLQFGDSRSDGSRRKDPTELYGDAIRSIISGIGFLMASMALLYTGVAGGRVWWWALLFPASTFLAKGISDLLKSRKMEKTPVGPQTPAPAEVDQPKANTALPPQQMEWAAPETRYKTGDLVPPSVTDNTTRQLEMDSEGQTMTLPKK